MGITIARLAELYPRLYHMAEVNTWDSIRENGLLSTTALLDLFGVNGNVRTSIESEHRPESVEIRNDKYGIAVVRDQKPLREKALRNCLVGLTPHEWYKLLNRKTFFWLTEARVRGLLSARAYRDRSHCVLTIDTAELLQRHSVRVRLSSINSGAVLYNPVPRGVETFLPLSDYPFEERRKKRGIANAIAELTVDYSVPDIEAVTLEAHHMRESEIIETLFER